MNSWETVVVECRGCYSEVAEEFLFKRTKSEFGVTKNEEEVIICQDKTLGILPYIETSLMSQTKDKTFSNSLFFNLFLIHFLQRIEWKSPNDGIIDQSYNNKDIFLKVNKIMEIKSISWIISIEKFSGDYKIIRKWF